MAYTILTHAGGLYRRFFFYEVGMVDIDSFKGRSSDKYIVKHIVDDSGDYESHYYSIIAIMPYGPRTVCEGMDNPYDALLFATAPDMIKEIVALRARLEEMEERISMASTYLSGHSEAIGSMDREEGKA